MIGKITVPNLETVQKLLILQCIEQANLEGWSVFRTQREIENCFQYAKFVKHPLSLSTVKVVDKIGLITYSPNHKQNTFNINDLYIIPEYRNKGFASKLIQDSIKFWNNYYFELPFEVVVETSNIAAIALFLKNKFVFDKLIDSDISLLRY